VTLGRRDFLRAASVLTGGLLASGAPRPALGADPITVTSALLAIGIAPIFTGYMTAKGFDREQGIQVVNEQTYVDPGTYYADFVAGRHDFAIGSWDTFAARYLQGVPIRLLTTVTTADLVGILVRPDGPKTVAELRGKQLAAPKATGTYRLSSLLLKRFHNLALESDVPVLNVPNPTAGVTYVLADRADAALAWEPSLSLGLTKRPDARILYSLGEDYRDHTKDTLYFFAFAAQKAFLEKNPGVDQRLVTAFRRTAEALTRNVDEAVTLAAKTMKIDEEAIRLAFKSKRIVLTIEPPVGATREALRRQADFLTENGVFPRKIDDAFFHTPR
jgi:NitT/TauT family transport system substrate-binding protein